MLQQTLAKYVFCCTFVILKLLANCPTKVSASESTFHEGLPVLKGKVVTGIYSEELSSQPFLYDKVVPLVFEFRLRSDLWTSPPSGFSKLKLLPRLNCRSDNKTSSASTSDWLFTCPVFFHVNEFIKYFKNNFTDVHPTFRNGMRQVINGQEYQKFSHHPSLLFEDCDQVISRTWKGVYGRDMGLSEYRVLLEKCNSLPNYFEDQIQDYNYDVSFLFDIMKDNFVATFFNVSNPNPIEMVNSLLEIQNLHLINTQSEISRLNDALLSCQNQMIPYSFLKGARLEKALQDIKAKLLPLKYTLPGGLTVSKLLKLPLADCIFGTSTLTVQILLPVIKADVNFSLLKFSYPSFLYKEYLCSVKSVNDLTTGLQPHYFLYDRASRNLLATKCPSSDREPCLIPNQSQRPLVNKCIYELLNASFEAIRSRDYCSLDCTKLNLEYHKKVLPLIQRVSPTRFVITVNRITPILVKCEAKPDEMITPQIYGGVEITLPCNCYIMYHDEKYYARSPCGNSLFIQHVVPDHMVNSSWNKETKFFLNAPTEKINFSLFSDTDTVSLLDLTSILTVKLSNNNESSEFDDHDHSQNLKYFPDLGRVYDNDACLRGHVILWIFIAFQSLVLIMVILFLLFKINYLTKHCDYGRSAVSFSVSQITNLDENK